ncbi:hypothetical protein [Alsobacter sp. R-9]
MLRLLLRLAAFSALVAAGVTLLVPKDAYRLDMAWAQGQPPPRAPAPAPAAPPSATPAPLPPLQQGTAAPRPLPASPFETMSRMTLEANFGGPLRDTVIQRLRDPIDGTVCYLYLPISVPHGPPLDDGMVRYGANPVGSISCVGASPAQPTAQRAPAQSTAPAPPVRR